MLKKHSIATEKMRHGGYGITYGQSTEKTEGGRHSQRKKQVCLAARTEKCSHWSTFRDTAYANKATGTGIKVHVMKKSGHAHHLKLIARKGEKNFWDPGSKTIQIQQEESRAP